MTDLVTKLPSLQEDLVTSAPVAQTSPSVSRDELDATATRLTDGQFTRGARAGFNNLGATFNAFVGNLAESAGLTEFAASRMAEAERFTSFAEAVGPDVKDYRQVKDFGTLVDYVAGALGNAAASTLPAVAGAAVGGVAGGVRGAFAGGFGGSFVPVSGEQALRIKDAPGTPGEKTANMLAVGTGGAAMETLLPGMAARRFLRPSLRSGSLPGQVAKGAAVESATETGQTALGQAGHTVLEPGRDKSGDRHELIESAIQGAIGGAGFGAASRTAEVLPGAVADGVQGVQKMLTRRQRVAEIADETPDAVDSDDLSKIISDPAIAGDPEAVGRAIDQLDTDEESSLTKIAKKMGEGAAKFEGWVNDPDKRAEFKAAAKQWVNDQKHAPRVKREWENTKKAFDEALEAGKAAYAEGKAPKRSDVRTKLDVQLHDYLMPRLPERTLNNLNPTQRYELVQYVKQAAEDLGRRPFPAEFLALLGPDAEGSVMGAIDIMEKSRAFDDRRQRSTFADTDVAEPMDYERVRAAMAAERKARVQKAVREARGKSRMFRDRVTEIVQEEMDDELLASPEDRAYATREFVRALNENPEMTADQNLWVREMGLYLEEKNDEEKQRLNPKAQRLMALAREVFKDPERALRRLGSVGDSVYLSQEEEDSIGLPQTKTAMEQAFEDGQEGTSDDEARYDGDGFVARRDVEASFAGDERLNRTYSPEEGRQVLRTLRKEYPASEVSFREEFEVGKDGKASVRIVAEPRDGSAMTAGDWKRVTDDAPGRKAGFEHGTITVKHKDGKTRRVSLMAMTAHAMRTSDRPGGDNYVPDMVLRGLGMVLGDPSVDSVWEKTGKDGRRLDGGEQWDFPDEMPVASHNGETWTWGMVREAMGTVDSESLRDAAVSGGLVDDALKAESAADIATPLNTARGQLKALQREAAEARAAQEAAQEDVVTPMEAMHEAVSDAKRDEMLAAAEGKALSARAIEAAEALANAEPKDKIALRQAFDRASLALRTAEVEFGQARDARIRAEEAVKGAQARNRRWYALSKPEQREKRDALRTATKAAEQKEKRAKKMEQTVERIEAELERRRVEGDVPFNALGESNVDAKMLDARPSDPDGDRFVQEETGETLDAAVIKAPELGTTDAGRQARIAKNKERVIDKGRPRRKGEAGYQPYEVGQRPEDRAAGPVTDVLAEEAAAVNAAGRESEAVQQQRSDEELSKFGDAIIGGAGQFQVLMNTAKRGDKMDLFDMRRMLASTEFGRRLSEIERPALKKLATERRDALLRALEAKKSAQTVKAAGPITDEEKAEAREYVKRVLGPQAKAVFKNLKHSGEFFEKDGVELLRIANLAMDPMGTARHEAAHALFARLLKHDKAAAQTLLAAAQSPHIVSRLRELLKDHPKALEQLSDPEERLAYMYQFWNSGDLKAGPKTEKWFDRVKAFFRKVASVWTGTFYESENADKAAQIFDLFDRGALSNRDTVAEVLRDKMVKSAVTRASELMGPAAKAARGLVYTSVSNVKAMNVPAFNEIMDKMWYDATKGGKAEPGFNQAKHPVRNRLLSKLEAAIGTASAETQREAIEALQSNTAPASAEARAVVKGVRELLAETFTYMKGKNVKAVVWSKGKYEEHDIGFVKDYFPRYYDKQAITERRGEFLAMLHRNGVPEAEAQEVFENVTRTQPRSPAENDYEVGLTYYAPNTQARKLDIPAAELAPFLRKDLGDAMRSYIAFAVRRGEYASRFGNQGQEIKAAEERAIKEQGATEEQVKSFNRAVQALEGSLGHEIDPTTRNAMGAVQTYQHLRLLPLALFSSLTVDPLGIMVRGGTAGDSFRAFARVVRNLVSESKDGAYDMAVAIGSISSAIDTHMLQEAYGMQDFGGMTQKVNSALFRWNGMDSLNRSMRVAATAAGHDFVVRHLTKPGAHSKRYLEELGLDESVKVTDGKLDLTDQRVADALNLWVDGAVLRPNAAIRPAWTSDPHWMLVSSLKQYMYAFQETIIKRVVHEVGSGNVAPAYALMAYVPAIIAADLLRAALTPGSGDDEAWERMDLSDVLLRGIQRAGVTGPMGQYALDAMGDMGHYNVPFASLAGPTGEQLFNLGKAAAGAPGSDLGREGLRALPGYIFLK